MEIFNFFRKITKEEKEPEKITINQLENWIKKQDEKIKKQDEKFVKQINALKQELIKSLGESIEHLQNYDLSKKKADQRVKLIVQENFNNYLKYTSNLIQDLDELTNPQSKSLIEKIDDLLINFQKKSELNFQKATFLIGETGEIKDSINEFVKQFKIIINENRELIQTNESLIIIKQKQREIQEIDLTEKKIEKNIKSAETEIDSFNKKIKEIKEEIKKIKNSEDYKKEQKQKQEIDTENKTLDFDFGELKKLINFKELTNKYHKNEKEMGLIREYKENFKESFEKDNGESLKELINEKLIVERIEKIKNLKNEINQLENNLNLKQGVEISIKEAEINRLNQQINSLKEEIGKNNKFMDKITGESEEIIGELKRIFGDVNLRLTG